MPVEATSYSPSAPICLTPPGDDPPKVDDKKKDEKKQLDQSAAAKSDAPATQKRDVVVFAAKIKRDGDGRAWAEGAGAAVLGTTCGGATKLTIDQLGTPLGPVGKAAVSLAGGAAGVVVGLGCAPAGSRAGGAVYDAVTGGPNTISFEAQTVQVDVPAPPAKAEPAKSEAAKAPTSNSTSAPVDQQTKPAAKSADASKTQPAASKPTTASPAPNASTLPYTPASAPASSAWTDPTARYLRPAAAK